MDIHSYFTWDAEKNVLNEQKHGISLEAAQDFDFASSYMVEDLRKNYGEQRYNSYGFHYDGRPMVLCWTPRGGRVRFISYRPMNDREIKKFLHTKK